MMSGKIIQFISNVCDLIHRYSNIDDFKILRVSVNNGFDIIHNAMAAESQETYTSFELIYAEMKLL